MTATPLPGRTHAAVERGAARREAILDAATRLIGRHGSRAVTLGEVAAEAGVTRPGLLHHFPSKDALIDATLTHHEERSAPAFARLAEPGGLASVALLVEVARKDHADREQLTLWARMVSESVEPGAPRHARLQRRYRLMRGVVEGFLVQARERGELATGVDPRAEATALLAFLNGIETSWLLDPDVDIVGITERHVAQTVARLRASPPPT